jgi:hypothetical protein
MVTPDEIGHVPLFAGLGADRREQLCRVAADVRLQPGE